MEIYVLRGSDEIGIRVKRDWKKIRRRETGFQFISEYVQ